MTRSLLSIFICFSFFSATAQELKFAKSFGGNSSEQGYVIAVDDTGNIYTAGTFGGTVDFDPGTGVFNLTAVGAGKTIYIQKLDSNGNFVWADAMGTSSALNRPSSIKLDRKGNVLVTGKFFGTMDADPGIGSFNISSIGVSSCFTVKLNNAGAFIWAAKVAGDSGDEGCASAVDDSCNVYVVGDFYGTADFDPGVGNAPVASGGYWDVFVVKLDSSGNFKWVKTVGAMMSDRCYAIEIDNSGNLYLCGQYGNTVDFDPGPGTTVLTGGNLNLFVLKLDRNGQFIWVAGTGGTLGDATALNLTLDKYGNVYTTGNFHSIVDFNTGAGVLNFSAGLSYDNYVLKLNNAGAFIWAKQIPGTGPNVKSFGITTDTAGNVYNTGCFSDSIDAAPGITTHLLVTGETDIEGYILKWDSAGSFLWAKQLVDIDDSSVIRAVTADKKRYIYTTGYFADTVDFNFMSPVFEMYSTGQADAFVQKLRIDTLSTAEVKPLINANNNNILIYPNPTTKTIHISSQEDMEKILVTDVLGRKVFEKLTNVGMSTSIDIGILGVYFISVYSKGNVSIQKILVNQ